MPINLKMPALSPTMEEGTLAKWLVKEGDTVASGDLLAEIETDKATMEFEAVDEGVIAKILIPAGTDNVKVGEVIAIIAGEGEEVGDAPAAAAPAPTPAAAPEAKAEPAPAPAPAPSPAPAAASGDDRIKASPLAKRIAAAKGIDLATIKGTGPGGRIVKADVEGAKPGQAAAPAPQAASAPAAS
ncbi:biotin/lipoyl-containing protein, partial [Erythrobacter donghaensis]